MSVTRRTLLAQAAAVGVGLPALADRAPRAGADPSGLVDGEPVPLAYEEIGGFLGEEQLRWHHESHYGGALASFNELDASPAGSHRKRVTKANSVLLHELYFANMTADSVDPGEASAAALKHRFGSVDRWVEDFRAAAKSCRGWAVLARHPVNGKLYNVCSDSHDDGPVWSGVPLVVVDVYEHAYYLDFQNRKGDYVDGFTDHVDWRAVERRLRT